MDEQTDRRTDWRIRVTKKQSGSGGVGMGINKCANNQINLFFRIFFGFSTQNNDSLKH